MSRFIDLFRKRPTENKALTDGGYSFFFGGDVVGASGDRTLRYANDRRVCVCAYSG